MVQAASLPSCLLRAQLETFYQHKSVLLALQAAQLHVSQFLFVLKGAKAACLKAPQSVLQLLGETSCFQTVELSGGAMPV